MDLFAHAENLITKEASAPGALEQDRVFNEKYFDAIAAEPDGKENMSKYAAVGELFIRTRIRERAVVRRLLDFETATDADLTPLPTDDEQPVIWGTIQNNSRGAVSLTMKDTADQETFWRNTFVMKFFVISTPEYYKNTFELKGHTHDFVKDLNEDMLLDIEEEEDRRWFTACDDIVGPLDGVGESGWGQNFYFGEFNRANFADSLFIFSDRKMPPGINVVNERFMSNFMKMDRSQAGGDLAEKLLLQGPKGRKEGEWGGSQFLFTSKNELVPDNVCYQFTAQDYLGAAREYQKPTMYMEKKKRMLFFSIEEIIAISIVNVAGVLRGIFENRGS